MMMRNALLAALILTVAGGAFASGAATPSLLMGQPEWLSAVGPTPLSFRVEAPEGGRGVLTLTLSTEDGALQVEVLQQPVDLVAGHNDLSLSLPAAALSGVNLWEDVTLDASLLLPDGQRVTDSADATVLAEPGASSRAAGSSPSRPSRRSSTRRGIQSSTTPSITPRTKP